MTQENGNNKLAVIRNYLRKDEIMTRFSEVLGNYQASAYVASVMLAVGSNRALQECSMTSIATSAMRAATLRLSCDPGIGQAYLVPFKGSATLVIGYKGLRDMGIRTGKYRYLHVAKIYEGETVIEDRVTGVHSIAGTKISDKAAGWLFYMELFTGYRKSVYMTIEEIHAHAKKYSKSYERPDSPWKTHTEMMEKKTLLRLGLSHWGYLDPYDLMVMSAVDDKEGSEDIVDGEFLRKDDAGMGASLEERDVEPEEEPVPEAPEEPQDRFPGENPQRPMSPDTLRAYLRQQAVYNETAVVTQDQTVGVVKCLEYLLRSKGARLEFLSGLHGKPVTTSKDLPGAMIYALWEYLHPEYDKANGVFIPGAEVQRYVTQEVTQAHAEWLKATGQQSLL